MLQQELAKQTQMVRAYRSALADERDMTKQYLGLKQGGLQAKSVAQADADVKDVQNEAKAVAPYAHSLPEAERKKFLRELKLKWHPGELSMSSKCAAYSWQKLSANVAA